MSSERTKTDLHCVREPDLRAYVLGELPSRVVRLVADHLSNCPACEAKARQFDQTTDPLIRGIRLAMRGDSHVGSTEALQNNGASAIAVRTPPPGYETIRELGRGGMGVVYLARQRHPNRLIAIKVLLAGTHSGPAGRARFLAEADAIARLQHPNIVQIFEVGEHDGLPFFAFEYVDGGSLADHLNGEPQHPRTSAELVCKLARAIQFAHQQAIVHRDLKPANILLQYSDRRLTIEAKDKVQIDLSKINNLQIAIPKIADFGLAKQAGPELTATGELIGTPSYMAPEQATGGAVGAAADIWALGAILYECLTGRPPFRGASQLETLEQVRTQEAVPPEQLRPDLSRDLSTVCLKCLEKDPKRRYITAAELADDLDRVLTDRHPLARRSTKWERGWRWCRRNPLAAGLAATIAALLPTALAVVTYWYWQSDAARRRAEQNFLRASAAVKGMTDAGQKLHLQKGTEEIGRKIIEKAAEFHEGFLADKGDEPAVLHEAARGWTSAAMCRASLGQITAAMKANDRSVELYDRLMAVDPLNATYRFERAHRLRAIGLNHLRWTTDKSACERAFVASRQSFQGLYDGDPDNLKYAFYLCNIMSNVAEMLRQHQRYEEALPAILETIAFQQKCIAKNPGNRDFVFELALAQETHGMLLWGQGSAQQGAELCREALSTLKNLSAESPQNHEYRWSAAQVTRELGDIALKARNLDEAKKEYKTALAAVDTLRREHPPFVTYAVSQLSLAVQLAELSQTTAQNDEADRYFQLAIAQAERLVADFPDQLVACRTNPTTAHLPYAAFLEKSGHNQASRTVLEAAHRVWPSDSAVNQALRAH